MRARWDPTRFGAAVIGKKESWKCDRGFVWKWTASMVLRGNSLGALDTYRNTVSSWGIVWILQYFWMPIERMLEVWWCGFPPECTAQRFVNWQGVAAGSA
jgi:hypothetical protein